MIKNQIKIATTWLTGIVSAIAIIAAINIDFRVATFGTIVMLVLMVALVIFAKLTKIAGKYFLYPALFMLWSFLILTVACASFLFSSVFFQWPVNLESWISKQQTGSVPRLEVRLRLVYEGFEVTIHNIGDDVAEDAFLQIVSWANGAPAADIRETIKLPPMVPNHKFSSILDLTDHGGKEWIGSKWVRASSSGYIVASCKNCRSTRAWAFYLPNALRWREFWNYFDKDGFWPLAEFRFPDESLGVGTYVRYPEFGQPSGWSPPVRVKGSRPRQG